LIRDFFIIKKDKLLSALEPLWSFSLQAKFLVGGRGTHIFDVKIVRGILVVGMNIYSIVQTKDIFINI